MEYPEKYEAIYASRPVLHFCERFNEASDIWDFHLHQHPYIELLFFLEGTASIEIAGTQLSVSLFDTVVYPAGCLHREDPSPDLKREVICLWVEMPELVLEAPLQIQDRSGQLSSLFRRIHALHKAGSQPPHLLEYYLKALMTLTLQYASEEQRRQVLPHAMQYLHTHFTGPVTLDTLAQLEHISKSYLSRQFKRCTGMTVIAYVHSLRMELAKHLLVTTDDRIAAIADQAGYESPKYFYRTFRAVCGQSPAEFRRTHTRRAAVQTAAAVRAGDKPPL